jgi:hypothetical protein
VPQLTLIKIFGKFLIRKQKTRRISMLLLVQEQLPTIPKLSVGMEVELYHAGKRANELVIQELKVVTHARHFEVKMKSLLWPQEESEFILAPSMSQIGWYDLLDENSPPIFSLRPVVEQS